MWYHEYRSLIVLEKWCHMPDSCGVEVIRRLIEQEYIWFLYECWSEEETGLLTSWEARYLAIEKLRKYLLLAHTTSCWWLWDEVYGIEDITDIAIDIVCIGSRVLSEKCRDRELFIFLRHDLFCYSHVFAASDEDTTIIDFQFSCDHLEYRRLTCPILSHESDLTPFADREARLIEEPLRCHIAIGDFVEADDDVSFTHRFLGYFSPKLYRKMKKSKIFMKDNKIFLTIQRERVQLTLSTIYIFIYVWKNCSRLSTSSW